MTPDVVIAGQNEGLPFERVIATEYYDGPIEGFTECSICGQAYSFRMLEQDEKRDLRVFRFSPLSVSLHAIAARLATALDKRGTVTLVLPFDIDQENFVRDLFAKHGTRVAVVKSWQSAPLVWDDITNLDPKRVNNWFSFLGM